MAWIASWKFVLWGGLNGLGIVVYKYWRKVSPYENSTKWFSHFWKILSPSLLSPMSEYILEVKVWTILASGTIR